MPIVVLAGGLMLASALMSAYWARRRALTGPTRLAWIVFCAALGLPALAAFVLMKPRPGGRA
jgi:hypothetical protein